MLYSDVSCNVQHTLDKMIALEFHKVIHVDYFALLTITQHGKVVIDGGINYSGIDYAAVLDYMDANGSELYRLEKEAIYAFSNGDDTWYLIVIPFREQKSYKVFSLSCALGHPYTDRDVFSMRFFTKVTYENVLLDNEVIKERNYLQNLFDSVDSFVIGMDAQGHITSANKKALALLGGNLDAVVGRPYTAFASGEGMTKLREEMDWVISENKSFTAKEEIFSNLRQETVYVNLTISPINDNQNEVVGVVLIGRDVTKETIYARGIEQIEQFALLGELASGLAHDIKNPLMSIRGCARILEKKIANIDDCAAFVDPIVYEVDRIDEKINQMLSYSFITQEELYSLLDINSVLEKCFNVVNFHKDSKYIAVEKRFSKDLPLIRGNNVQLQQAFLNVLFNAVQAIDMEGTICIESVDVPSERRVRVSVSDNGKGMSGEEMRKIFKPFYSTKVRGTGLGLPIVKRVIEKYGGEIRVQSREREGTAFEVYLPYAEEVMDGPI